VLWDGKCFATHGLEAIFLICHNDHVGWENWYQEYVPRADAIYAQHLTEIDEEADSLTGK
jgi:hypothetical protein